MFWTVFFGMFSIYIAYKVGKKMEVTKLSNFYVDVESQQLGIADNILKAEFSFTAKYRGTSKILPTECSPVIVLVGQSLYIGTSEDNFLYVGIPSITYITSVSAMGDYMVMGGPAILMAAEMTKYNAGINVEITYTDKDDAPQKFRLTEVPTGLARRFSSRVYDLMDIPVTVDNL